MNNYKETSLLHKTVKWLNRAGNFLICIHDTSGILHNTPEFILPHEYMMHNCNFCRQAKTTATGFRFCLRCKAHSVKKAMALKDMYIGRCYLGITEIIKPVYYNDTLWCILYIGNILIEEQRAEIIQRFDRISLLTGVSSKLLVNSLKDCEEISSKSLEEYKELVDILHRNILNLLENTPDLKNKSASSSPVYTEYRHWVIEAVQNYILEYYDKDIKLSYLAQLYFINPQYLCRLFKASTGTNFSDYVNKVRIQKSMELLSTTSDSIVEISAQVGYNNVTYFNRLFKKQTGTTPKQYRSSR